MLRLREGKIENFQSSYKGYRTKTFCLGHILACFILRMTKLVILGLVLLVLPEGYEHRNIPLSLNGKLKRQQDADEVPPLLEDAIQNSWSRFKRALRKTTDNDDVDIYTSQEAPQAPPHSHEHEDPPKPAPPHSHEHEDPPTPAPPHSHEHEDPPVPAPLHSHEHEDPPAPVPPHSHEHDRHILDHILHEIHNGHVTQDKMDHWWREIQDALNKGTLTMDEVHQLMEAVGHTYSHHDETCCWFG
ncbi:uncharacterized protein LOC123561369 [Mercenaria mercenaria]|uniref:uncharacterized protein LOC123561369 n=1 Tax=Mercenaria mercenaria TaxID=6596 RepID=UPI00234F99C9|nr:uncharacterized protein LOC123561369 [Mercenaria mercenaria]